MRILVVFSHPSPESFQRSILDALTARLGQGGHDVRVIDLYAEGFDPMLGLEAWKAHRRNEANTGGVEDHVHALREAEGLILVYPTWWYGLPAMLKGWFDRVWQPGVAFAIAGGTFRTHWLTRITRFAVITTCGSPGWFIELIAGDGARRQVMRGLKLQLARGARSRWRAIYGVDNRSREDLARARDRAVAAVAELFEGR